MTSAQNPLPPAYRIDSIDGPRERSYEFVRVEHHGRVVEIVLNRPEAHNAMSNAMAREIIAVTTAVGADRAVRAVVLSSSSPKAFSVGADLGHLPRGGAGQHIAPQATATMVGPRPEWLPVLPYPTLELGGCDDTELTWRTTPGSIAVPVLLDSSLGIGAVAPGDRLLRRHGGSGQEHVVG